MFDRFAYRRGLLWAVLATSVLGPVAPLGAAEAVAPRLVADSERFAAVRAAAAVPASHHAEALAALRARVTRSEPDGACAAYDDGGSPRGYRLSWLAREAAFLARLQVDRPAAIALAAKAHAAVAAMYASGNERRPDRGSGLSRAMTGLGMALAWDWAREWWTPDQRAQVADWLRLATDGMLTIKGPLGHGRTSNWVAVCRGAELVMRLALDGVAAREQERTGYLVRELLTHMRNTYGDLGLTPEGMGYQAYGGSFLAPAVLCAASMGDDRLRREYTRHAFWRLNLYTRSFQPPYRRFVTTGVDSLGNYSEGWASLNWAFVPEAQRPFYRWWYDRHIGIASSYDRRQRFDSQRAGTTWALLYYPPGTPARDPTGSYPSLVQDDRGGIFFRDGWRDGGDVLMSLVADTVLHRLGWRTFEVGGLSLLAADAAFIRGPGKAGKQGVFTSLRVDDEAPSKYKRGAITALAAWQNGFRAQITGGDGFTIWNQRAWRREVVLDCDPADDRGLLVIHDHAACQEDQQVAYSWHLRPGTWGEQQAFALSAETDGPLPCLRLRSPLGHYCDLWVLRPQPVGLQAEPHPRLDLGRAEAVDVVVVAAFGRGTPPQPEVVSDGDMTTLHLAGRSIAVHGSPLQLEFASRDGTPRPATAVEPDGGEGSR